MSTKCCQLLASDKLYRFQTTLNRSLSVKPADVLFGTIGSAVRSVGGFFKRQERDSGCN